MKPIFTRNDDIDKIAFLSWRIHNSDGIRNLLNIADGYLSAAIRLAKLNLITNRDKSADILIFPMLNNVNHGIEIYLKGIMWSLNIIMKSPEKIQKGHNLLQLYRTVRTKIRQYGGSISIDVFDQANKALKDYLDELFSTIEATDKKDNMDFSRYPFNTSFENHFYVEDIGNVVVDLENFVTTFEHIQIVLKNISNELYYNEIHESDE